MHIYEYNKNTWCEFKACMQKNPASTLLALDLLILDGASYKAATLTNMHACMSQCYN